ncbi:nuclear transport factor 2 family protein [Novosphingobium cyanobacteriorum]|uniref:Nuclear transport factor 2 family protein n=1 Tax=Novosphingobium cyanobacteriorum TaxID=3024215 RepID=A0ABT6CNX0_9SPHN|nr:nuclear transport factor 2 family protein [Novosphingobium cyanobacteriorum]MDF8334938.1 nuclear transport factor 2 family protein [Novosphingobium cyanobacteriorum]
MTGTAKGNAATEMLCRQFGFGPGIPPRDAFGNDAGPGTDPFANIHPDARFSMFGPTGTKEQLVGKAAYVDFVTGCAAALADRSDEILAIVPVDAEGAFVHGRAWRKSKASGEEIRYEWAMLFRVEQGLISYGADMLDANAQAFWGRVLGERPAA